MNFFKRKKAAEQPTAPPGSVPQTGERGQDDAAALPVESTPVPAPGAQVPTPEPEPGPDVGTVERVEKAERVERVERVERTAPESPAAPGPAAPAPGGDAQDGFFRRLRRGLGRTSDNLVQGVGSLFLGGKEIDDELLEELESSLLLADVGVDATVEIVNRLTERVSRRELTRPEALEQALREELQALLQPCERPLDPGGHRPFVILMVGVNGVGKTTTIGKLARRYLAENRSVMLAAGDTFRAAAVEQLQAWGERNGVPVIAQHKGADSASVLYDGLQAAQARGTDILIADTAGRLHNQEHLMEELRKVVRVIRKLDPEAPHEVMLVLDAGTGQNALSQARQFQQAVGVTGITLTKLDGTAKGGVIFAIAKKLCLPIRYIGVGEALEDLHPFEAEPFIRALFARDDKGA